MRNDYRVTSSVIVFVTLFLLIFSHSLLSQNVVNVHTVMSPDNELAVTKTEEAWTEVVFEKTLDFMRMEELQIPGICILSILSDEYGRITVGREDFPATEVLNLEGLDRITEAVENGEIFLDTYRGFEIVIRFDRLELGKPEENDSREIILELKGTIIVLKIRDIPNFPQYHPFGLGQHDFCGPYCDQHEIIVYNNFISPILLVMDDTYSIVIEGKHKFHTYEIPSGLHRIRMVNNYICPPYTWEAVYRFGCPYHRVLMVTIP